MSYDLQIGSSCPHIVREEYILVGPDRLVARPMRPIANIASVRVRLNGLKDVPSQGVKTPARATSKAKGPFNIPTSGASLLVQVGGVPYTLSVQPGTKISAERLAEQLASQVPDLTATAQNGYIVLQTRTIGPQASLIIRGGGLVSILGLVSPRVWGGAIVVPGWSLVSDPLTLSDRPARCVVFDHEVPGYTPFLEIDYGTLKEECRRCGGLGTESDVQYLPQGGKVAVRDEDLLMQEIQKFSFTVKGSNGFHTWYGTSMLDAIGKKTSNAGITQNIIVSELYEGFRRWQSIKRQQEDQVGQYVSDQEFPQRILGVTLEPSQDDPTVVFVNASIQSRASTLTSLSRAVRLPYLLNFPG